MRFVLRLVVFLLVAVVAAIGIAFVLPSTSHVERSITIDRPASQIYMLLSGFKRFNEWSPWAARDPDTKYTWSGPDSGVGAKLAWSMSWRQSSRVPSRPLGLKIRMRTRNRYGRIGATCEMVSLSSS